MANEIDFSPQSEEDFYWKADGVTDNNTEFDLGWDNTFSTVMSGALRFPGVTVDQGVTVAQATLTIRVDSRQGSSSVLAKVYGIKETDTAQFGHGVDSRPRTTATNTHSYGGGGGGYFSIDVTNIVNEILAQGGWSSGNAMGFYIDDNGTTHASTNVLTEDFDGSLLDDSILSIRISAEPDFLPDPKEVAEPTFPAAEDYGIKIAVPGPTSVFDATEEELLFTTRRHYLKVVEQDLVAVTDGVQSLLEHGLGYAPLFLGFMRVNGKSFAMPRMFFSQSGNPTDWSQGQVYANPTYFKIYPYQDCDVYYYIFLDQHAT